MQRDILALADREFDLVVVGGGIAGVFVAWDAALRGLSVALLERGDFSGATTAHSLKFIHGGIRYLQHADLPRLRESCRERSMFLRIAPHLCRAVPVVIPTYGHGMKGKEILGVAFKLLSLLTLDRNFGLPDPDRRFPAAHTISRDECLRMFPDVEREGLTGAGVFYDGQIYNPPRLIISILRSAVDAGAIAANYCDVDGFLKERDRITGVQAVDRLSGESLEVRAKIVVNAAGPFAEEFLVRAGIQQRRYTPLSRDMAFVINQRLDADHTLAVQTRFKDPDAILSRGARHLFLVPWRTYTLIGVNSKVHTDPPDELRVTEEEIQTFVEEINLAYPPLALKIDDISVVHAGLLPFGHNEPDATHLSFGKRSLLIDHAKRGGPHELITIISNRLTTGRHVAQDAVDLVYRKLNSKPSRCITATEPVYGGRIERFREFLDAIVQQRPSSLTPDVMQHLAYNYGSSYRDILGIVKEDPRLGKTIGTSNVIMAEIVHGVREEMAQKLSDVVLRRSDLGTGEFPGDSALRTCAELMATVLNWDEPRIQREMEEVRGLFPTWTTVTGEVSSR